MITHGTDRRGFLLGALAAAALPRLAWAAPPAFPTRQRWGLSLGSLRVPFVLDGDPRSDLPKVQAAMAALLQTTIQTDAPTVLARIDGGGAATFARVRDQLGSGVVAAGYARPVVPPDPPSFAGADPTRRSVACTIATFACVLRWHGSMAAALAAPAVDVQQPPGPALAIDSLGLGFGDALLRKAGLGSTDPQLMLRDRPMTAWQTRVVATEVEEAFASLRGTPAEAAAASLGLALGYYDILAHRPVPPVPPVDRALVAAANDYAERVMLVTAAVPLWRAIQ